MKTGFGSRWSEVRVKWSRLYSEFEQPNRLNQTARKALFTIYADTRFECRIISRPMQHRIDTVRLRYSENEIHAFFLEPVNFA